MTLPASREAEKERARQSDKEPEGISRIVDKARKRKGFCNTVHREEKKSRNKEDRKRKKEEKEKNGRKRTNRQTVRKREIVNIIALLQSSIL